MKVKNEMITSPTNKELKQYYKMPTIKRSKMTPKQRNQYDRQMLQKKVWKIIEKDEVLLARFKYINDN